LAASGLGLKSVAKHDLTIAAQINPRQRVVQKAMARVLTAHPLAPAEALRMLVLVN
jgi:hypothetical protein